MPLEAQSRTAELDVLDLQKLPNERLVPLDLSHLVHPSQQERGFEVGEDTASSVRVGA